MPKRKSGQQVLDTIDVKDGQGNLMLDAKQWVACSNHAGDAIDSKIRTVLLKTVLILY